MREAVNQGQLSLPVMGAIEGLVRRQAKDAETAVQLLKDCHTGSPVVSRELRKQIQEIEERLSGDGTSSVSGASRAKH